MNGDSGARDYGDAGAMRSGRQETQIWSGTPSQWTNFWPFLMAGTLVVGGVIASVVAKEPLLLLVAAAGPLVAVWPWLQVRCTNIEVTSERVSTRTGVFTRRKSDMELYRVKDTTLHEPFFLRLVSLANLELVSSDKTTPLVIIPAVRNAEELRQNIRANVERMRMERRVRELDFE